MNDSNRSGSAGKIIKKPTVQEPPVGEDIPFPEDELNRLSSRKWILNYARKGAIGAEIGVFRGHFSSVLAEILQPTKLYLVDPWRKLGKDFGWGKDSPYTGYGKLTTEYAYHDTIRRMSRFSSIDISIIEGFALDFFQTLAEKLDWVYLDASHQYEATLNELKLIDAVLKPDGVIIGDDWHPASHHRHHGVYRAIHEFVSTYSYEIVAAGPAAQWCLRRRTLPATNASGVSVIYTHNNSVIVEAFVDAKLLQVDGDAGISLTGAVVLGDNINDGKLVIQGDAGSYSVQWGLPSPRMAKKFPDNPQAAYACYKVENIIVPSDQVVRLLLVSPTRGTWEVACLSAASNAEYELTKQQVCAALDRLRETIRNFRRVSGKGRKGQPWFMLAKPAPLLPASAVADARVYADRESLLDSLPAGGVVAEVGTQFGHWARRIIERKTPKEVHLFDLDFTLLRKEIAGHPAVVLHQGDSSQALAKCNNDFFDWIYIDGDHAYQSVRRDIEQAVLKVKPGGILIFNDYVTWSPVEAAPYGVVAAVNELIITGWKMVAIALTPTGYWDVAVRRSSEA